MAEAVSSLETRQELVLRQIPSAEQIYVRFEKAPATSLLFTYAGRKEGSGES